MKIWIMRHGQGWHNMCSGTAFDERSGTWVTTGPEARDAKLTRKGESQAASWNEPLAGTAVQASEDNVPTTLAALLGDSIELIMISPLKRCLQTALLALGEDDQPGGVPGLPVRICRHAREVPFDDLCNECDENAGAVHALVSTLPRGQQILELAGSEQQEILAIEREMLLDAPSWGTGSLDEALLQPRMDVTDWRGQLWRILSDARRQHPMTLSCCLDDLEEQSRVDALAALEELDALEAADSRTPERIAAEGPLDVHMHLELLFRALPDDFLEDTCTGSSWVMKHVALERAHEQAVLVNLRNELAARQEREIFFVAHYGVINMLLQDDCRFGGHVGNCDVVEAIMNTETKRLTWVATHKCPYRSSG